MAARRPTQLFFRRAWLAFAFLLFGTLACDDVSGSLSMAMVEKSFAAPPANASEDPIPNMESIGPDEAMRIYYQFVDDRGRVQFVERLSDVPDAWRDQVGYVEMSQPPPLTPKQARDTWKLSSARTEEILLASAQAALNDRANQPQNESVILYSATWCGYCTKARAHLDREGIQYEVRDVDNGAIGRELREKTGRGGVPVLDFSGEILRGYSADAYNKAIQKIRG